MTYQLMKQVQRDLSTGTTEERSGSLAGYVIAPVAVAALFGALGALKMGADSLRESWKIDTAVVLPLNELSFRPLHGAR